jgi:predicted transcriptional regulator
VTKKNREENKLLTETELELMTSLWKLGEGSVNDVLEQLPKGRELAYTSVSTILRILEQKQTLTSRKEGRGHIYIPAIKKDQYEALSLKHLVSKVFDGEPSTLVKRLIESKDLDDEELKAIRALLNRRIGS